MRTGIIIYILPNLCKWLPSAGIKLTYNTQTYRKPTRKKAKFNIFKIKANKFDFKRLERTILKFRPPYIFYIILAVLKLAKNDKAKAKIADRHYETMRKIMSRQLSYGRNANYVFIEAFHSNSTKSYCVLRPK